MPSTDTSLPIDKIVHFVEYGILGFLLFRAISYSGRISLKLSVVFVIFCAMAVGLLDESYQSITGRNADVYDWLFDSLGATISSFSLALYTRAKRA